MDRFRYVGLQRRIMLYVVVGLAAMFGVLAFLGLGAIDQATQLVFQERLTTAYTTAGILERDFARVADDAAQTSQELALIRDTAVSTGAAQSLLTHFERASPYAFFRVTGVWLVDARGHLLDEAGLPIAADVPDADVAAASLVQAAGADYTVGRAIGQVPGGIAFATVAVRLGAPASSEAPAAIVATVSVNSTADYVPAAYGRAGATPPPGTPSGVPAGYHLEVVAPDGIAVLGIGSDERPGEMSHHFPAITTLMARHAAAAMVHEPGPTDSFAPHVMAVVPLASTPFYVVIEQPIDVALALPHQLGQRLLLTITLGFLAALLVAWITTRHVVKPTEELTAAAGRMAEGDLASPIDVRADDEVGLLAENLEVMRQQLKAAHEATEATNRELEVRVADRTARLNQVLGQTINAQEEERRRLARELHDETAQTLAALTITLDRARDGVGTSSTAALELIGDARSTAGRLLAETRRLIVGLRPAVLDDLGLVPAIRWYAETTLPGRGVEATVEADQPVPRLPGFMEVALFRIVQEAITNVARHAQAHHATIRLAFRPDAVTVTVADDGTGFDVDGALDHAGPDAQRVGLVGMQERVRLLNGHIDIRSSEGGGTTLVVDVPISSEVS